MKRLLRVQPYSPKQAKRNKRKKKKGISAASGVFEFQWEKKGVLKRGFQEGARSLAVVDCFRKKKRQQTCLIRASRK